MKQLKMSKEVRWNIAYATVLTICVLLLVVLKILFW